MTSAERPLIPNIGYARSTFEVRFWLHLHRCPRCGDRDLGEPKYESCIVVTRDGATEQRRPGGYYYVTCPRCAHQRSIEFFKAPSFCRPAPESRHLGGVDASQIIAAHEFAVELVRCASGLRLDFDDITKEERAVMRDLHWDGAICVNELLKFLPEGADAIPDEAFTSDDARAYRAAHPEQFTRAYLEERGEYFRGWRAALEADAAVRFADQAAAPPLPPVLPPLSLASLKFHEQWVRDGGEASGGIRLVARGVDARERSLAGRDLSGAVLDKVTLDRASLARTGLRGAQLTEVYLRDASLAGALLDEATLARCQLAGSELAASSFVDATLEACDFARAGLDRASLVGARLTGCSFAGATLTSVELDRAVFVDCDLRGARLGLTRGLDDAPIEVRFVRCDLRDTDWLDSDLRGVQLLACKLAGTRGSPTVDDTTVVSEPDLSPAGDGSQPGNARDVFRLWSPEGAG